MTSLTTYGEISPSSLDLLTRFHPLNERSLLEKTSNKAKESETKMNPTPEEADETKMKGVGDAKTRTLDGRGSEAKAQFNSSTLMNGSTTMKVGQFLNSNHEASLTSYINEFNKLI